MSRRPGRVYFNTMDDFTQSPISLPLGAPRVVSAVGREAGRLRPSAKVNTRECPDGYGENKVVGKKNTRASTLLRVARIVLLLAPLARLPFIPLTNTRVPKVERRLRRSTLLTTSDLTALRSILVSVVSFLSTFDGLCGFAVPLRVYVRESGVIANT